MIALDAQALGLLDTIQDVQALPKIFYRARRSALSSTGWWIRGKVLSFIGSKGRGRWAKIHPLTQHFYKKARLRSRWTKRRKHPGTLSWLAKFVRYRVNRKGTRVHIDFGKGRRGQAGQRDPFLSGVVRRIQKGQITRVTKKMRRFWGYTRRKRPKNQVVGMSYFPLSSKTKQLVTEPRPIIDPVLREVAPKIPNYFRNKFIERVRKYEAERRSKRR